VRRHQTCATCGTSVLSAVPVPSFNHLNAHVGVLPWRRYGDYRKLGGQPAPLTEVYPGPECGGGQTGRRDRCCSSWRGPRLFMPPSRDPLQPTALIRGSVSGRADRGGVNAGGLYVGQLVGSPRSGAEVEARIAFRHATADHPPACYAAPACGNTAQPKRFSSTVSSDARPRQTLDLVVRRGLLSMPCRCVEVPMISGAEGWFILKMHRAGHSDIEILCCNAAWTTYTGLAGYEGTSFYRHSGHPRT
jgi:hypothetical protein